jgi:hypothetical protein
VNLTLSRKLLYVVEKGLPIKLLLLLDIPLNYWQDSAKDTVFVGG